MHCLVANQLLAEPKLKQAIDRVPTAAAPAMIAALVARGLAFGNQRSTARVVIWPATAPMINELFTSLDDYRYQKAPAGRHAAAHGQGKHCPGACLKYSMSLSALE